LNQKVSLPKRRFIKITRYGGAGTICFFKPPFFLFFFRVLVLVFLFFLKQYNQIFFRKVEHQTNGAAFYLVVDAHIKLPTLNSKY